MTARRSVHGGFRHDGRVAAGLVPSLIILAGFGGKIPVGIALVGAMVCYILDALRYKEGALGAVWLTLGSVNLSLWLSGAILDGHRPLLLSLMIGGCSGTTLFTTGVWATLQFRWIQVRYPVVVLAFEKLLLGVTFSLAGMVQAWGLIAAVGASHAPFYLAPLLCGLYYLLELPLLTSFHVRGAKPSLGGKDSKELQIQGPAEGACAAVILTLLPASLYGVVHWSMMAHWIHVWSFLLLASGPVLFLSILEEGLWWLPGGPRRRNAIRRVLLLGALATAIVALEGRLIFPAFGQYIQMHPPWNYAAVTVTLFGFAALAVLYLAGMLGEALNNNLAGTVLIVSASLGSIAAGIPLTVMAAPLVSAGGLALALESRQLRDYGLFVVGGAITLAWFIVHHFWFLDIDMQGISLQRFCVLLWLAALPALILPGLVISDGSKALISILLVAQAVLVSFLEEHMYNGVEGLEGEIYPAAMVVATSGLGIAVLQRLKRVGKVGRLACWLGQSMHAAKLSMLVLPQASLPLPVFVFILAASAPLLLGDAVRQDKTGLSSPPPWQGLLCVAATLLATFAARNAVYEVLHLTLGARPLEGLLVGTLLLVAAGGCLPLVSRGHGHGGRRALSFLAAFGVLLVLLQPPIPLQAGAVCPAWLPPAICFRLWDAQHTPERELDDAAIWSEYGEDRERWPLWALLGGGLSLLAAATDKRGVRSSATRSLVQASLTGLSVGGYVALEFFPGQPFLQAVFVVATLALGCVLFGLRTAGSASPALLAMLLLVWACGFPASLLAQSLIPLPLLPEDARRLFADNALLVEQQRQLTNRAALLTAYSSEALLLAFAMKLRVAAASPTLSPARLEVGTPAARLFSMGNQVADRAASFLGQCMPVPGAGLGGTSPMRRRASSLPGGLGGTLGQLDSQGLAWLPTAVNFITLACFACSLWLATTLTEGSELAIFVLAPMLLLMCQDTVFCALDARRRYFPVAFAVSCFLAASALWQSVDTWRAPSSVTDKAAGSSVALLRNIWLTAATLPSHFYCCQYLWSRAPTSGERLLFFGPLNILAALFTDFRVVRVLAGTGVLMSCAQFAAMSRIRTEGLRLL